MTIRTDRMMQEVPDYYEMSQLYKGITESVAAELDKIDAGNKDVKNQLYIRKATWGLVYWEEALKIPTVEEDGYDIRRSRVLSAWRGFGQFSAKLVKSIAESYGNGEVQVSVNIPEGQVIIEFVGSMGVPENINDLKARIDNIIHAHLEAVYEFKFNLYSDTKAAFATYADLKASGLTYAQLLVEPLGGA